MARKKKEVLPAVVTPPEKKTKKQLTLAVTRILKREKFSPLSILINQVFPHLDHEKQADVLLKLLPYVYPSIKAEELVPRKRGPAVQINTQVNATPPAQVQQHISRPQIALEDLLKLAANKD